MCGIAGFVGGFEPGLMARMNAAQSHRGPDGQGLFEDPVAEVGLAHVRLAILDLSDRGAQPMHSRDGRYVLTYNGEIYNFQELRDGLEADGFAFRSTSDTEVLLTGLTHQGESFVERLDGMFAFALWDRRRRTLLLARDPIGVKPLYYAQPAAGTLLFASEIKALCAHSGLRREPDYRVLQQHLTFCHATGERTALAGVRRLAPGKILRWDAETRRCRQRRTSRLAFGGCHSSRAEAVAELRSLLEKTVRRQLISDVPVGTFFSGGLDSTLLTALAARHHEAGLGGFTITYPAEDNTVDAFEDDAPYARAAAEDLGLSLREIEIRPDVTTLWPRLVRHLDEPLADPAAIGTFLISRLAREEGTPVLLSGQGADELFAGYPRYQALSATRPLDVLPSLLRRRLAALGRRLPGSREHRGGRFLRRARRVLAGLDLPPDQRFLALCAYTAEADLRAVLAPAFVAEAGGESPASECLARMERRGLTGMDRFLERDLATYLPNHNLLYTDKMGMAVGLEARVPLVGLEIAAAAARYPAAWKLHGTTTKAILRDAARGLVPDAVLRRPKAGFGAPFRKWLRYDLAPMWDDLTSREAVARRGWFDYSQLQEARRRSQSGAADLYMLQWAVLTVELWARQFIDSNPATEV